MKKFFLSFTQLSMYTGYALAIFTTLMFFWTKDPQDLKIVPLVKLFVDTAQVSAKMETNKESK